MLPDDEKLTPEPNLNDPAQAMVHRALEAIQRAFKEEFAGEKHTPNVTVVATVPPDGRVGVASTEPDPRTTLLALKMGWGAVHRAWRLSL